MASKDSTALTAETLRSLFSYDAATGIFRRLRCADVSHIGDNPTSLDDWGYIRFRVSGRKYRAHRLAWLYVHGTWPTGQLDHINGNKLDNRIENLRDVSPAANAQNKRRPQARNRTGFLGVSVHNGTGKFVAQISADGRKYHLGLFDKAEEAGAAYLEAKRRLHPGLVEG